MKPLSENKAVLYDSPEAATYVKNIEGWVDINRRFFGNNKESEHLARYSGCTHVRCDCGNLTEKSWLKCEKCRWELKNKKYEALPFVEWYGIQPVCLAFGDEYFFSEEQLQEWIEEQNEDADDEDKITEVDLLICEPIKLRRFSTEYWDRSLPEDWEPPRELQEAIDALNNVIDKLPAQSYLPGKKRTKYKYNDK